MNPPNVPAGTVGPGRRTGHPMIVGGGHHVLAQCIVAQGQERLPRGEALRLSAVVSTVILLACAGLGTLAAVRGAPPVQEAATGIDVLRSYGCRQAETKTIILRGVEDNHSPAGNEPNAIRPGRRFPDTLTFFAGGSYDQIQADRRWTDSFEAPRHTASGILVLGLKPVAANDTDTIAVGDISAIAVNATNAGRFGSLVAALETQPGWSRRGDLYIADLAAVRLNSRASQRHASLLDLIRAGGAEGWIDVLVQDDTSVDFMGVALCLELPRGNGMTLAPAQTDPPTVKGIILLSCTYGGRDHRICDQYKGDTACTEALPVACFRPMSAPVPRGLDGHYASSAWSGGRLEFTEPTPGARFSSRTDVNRFCAARFGPGWRAAELHDGNLNSDIAGFGGPVRMKGRVWVDVMGGPYATCWAQK